MALALMPAADPAADEDALTSATRTLKHLKRTQASAATAREGTSFGWEWYFGWGRASAPNATTSTTFNPTPAPTTTGTGANKSNAAPQASSPMAHKNWPWRTLGSSGRPADARRQAWQQEVQKTRDFLAGINQGINQQPATSDTPCMVRPYLRPPAPLASRTRTTAPGSRAVWRLVDTGYPPRESLPRSHRTTDPPTHPRPHSQRQKVCFGDGPSHAQQGLPVLTCCAPAGEEGEFQICAECLTTYVKSE